MSADRTVRDCLAKARTRLIALETAALDAEVLLTHVLGVNRAWLYANGEANLPADKESFFNDLVKRRTRGEPIAYLLGRREFWSLSFRVTANVLIPRPETEMLVETALALYPAERACRVADLGTGSGAVAIALASERPGWEIHATDLSPEALNVATRNALTLTPGRVQFHLGSWLQPLEGLFDLVVSNPPYVNADDPHLERGDCRFEPRMALTPGSDGLVAIGEITAAAKNHLTASGWLIFEHGFDQGQAVRSLLTERGFEEVSTRKDLEGRDRISLGRKP